MKRKMFLVSVLIIMSMWVSASASTLEQTNINGGAVYTSPNLTITISVLPKDEKVPKEIDARSIIGYAITNDYATVRDTSNATGKIVRSSHPGTISILSALRMTGTRYTVNQETCMGL